eukprot:7095614-Prymnesium_polylepis.1
MPPSFVAKALSHARSRRAQRTSMDDVYDEEPSKVYEAMLTRDQQGFGMGIEMRRFEGEHLGSLSDRGYSHLIVSIDVHGPAYRRGFKLLDRVRMIDDEELDDPDVARLVEGKESVVFTIERYRGDALLSLAWHMAIASCVMAEVDMIEPCVGIISRCGMDARRLRLRGVDAREFQLTEGVALLPGSTLADVATAAGHRDMATWLDAFYDEGAERADDGGASEGESECASSTTQEFATPRSHVRRAVSIPTSWGWVEQPRSHTLQSSHTPCVASDSSLSGAHTR